MAKGCHCHRINARKDFNSSHCSNKLIGAQFFNKAAHQHTSNITDSPRDQDRHGTHTATTAAGGFVVGAEMMSSARGTAVGVAPQAHLAMYQVCYGIRCIDSDIMAGFDKAIQDGVDVLSISLSGGQDRITIDPITISAFKAMEKGIFVSCSTGNKGPDFSTVGNVAPWVLTFIPIQTMNAGPT
ncbi:hypothetical protein AMTR_s00044p00138670 [Amborella trichopoda]|uniref:Peptidase S8/S53 domain-containing protein n=1 Tax=Amborella trichopoda TaxID=13333 RepID=U5D4L7_AMBTC|nr:hypothetical protein AMTR_s00044p00138670 [Amborella trichopoda]